MLKNDEELRRAIEIVDHFLSRELNEYQALVLDIVSDAIHEYESIHCPIPDTSPLDMLTALMMFNGLDATKLAKELDMDKNDIDLILNFNQKITQEQAEAFGKRFCIDSSVFLSE